MSLKTWTEKWLSGRHLPVVLALAAIIVMLPALWAGLGMDDLVQRTIQLSPEDVPPGILETGFAQRSGTLEAVLTDLFGFRGEPEAIRKARDYGLLPWWMREDIKAALWRPLTAFTHWVEYRLYPDSPVLMHAQNIAWFAGAVFLAAILYRRMIEPSWVAGLAGLLFLLDKNTFFPVLFVANRGFILSLFFGLLALHEHQRWRITGRRAPMIFSLVALAAALFSNEGGVSTLAFILAYALVMEKVPSGPDEEGHGSRVELWLRQFGRRVSTVLPALGIVALWRIVYQSMGFGVAGLEAYIDPSQEPAAFFTRLAGRSLFLLTGQLTGVPPEAGIIMHPTLQNLLLAGGCLAVVLILAAAMPLLRRERVAQFWFVTMVLATVPAATVVPLSKNMGFISFAAFGWVALFIGNVAEQLKTRARAFQVLTWAVCTMLLFAHIAAAIGARAIQGIVAPRVFDAMHCLSRIGHWPGMEDNDVVLVNSPSQLSMTAVPFLNAYEGRPLPKTMRSLLPGGSGYEVTRADETTLLVRSIGSNIFHHDMARPVHAVYALERIDRYFRQPTYSNDCRILLSGLEVNVVETDSSGLPSVVRFQFGQPLEANSFHWLYFDWEERHYLKFNVPGVGKTAIVVGPR